MRFGWTYSSKQSYDWLGEVMITGALTKGVDGSYNKCYIEVEGSCSDLHCCGWCARHGLCRLCVTQYLLSANTYGYY